MTRIESSWKKTWQYGTCTVMHTQMVPWRDVHRYKCNAALLTRRFNGSGSRLYVICKLMAKNGTVVFEEQ